MVWTTVGPYKGYAITNSAEVTGSEVQRYGIGVVQEIDSTAMHLFRPLATSRP
jgi:hypothetical protein